MENKGIVGSTADECEGLDTMDSNDGNNNVLSVLNGIDDSPFVPSVFDKSFSMEGLLTEFASEQMSPSVRAELLSSPLPLGLDIDEDLRDCFLISTREMNSLTDVLPRELLRMPSDKIVDD